MRRLLPLIAAALFLTPAANAGDNYKIVESPSGGSTAYLHSISGNERKTIIYNDFGSNGTANIVCVYPKGGRKSCKYLLGVDGIDNLFVDAPGRVLSDDDPEAARIQREFMRVKKLAEASKSL